MPADDQVPSAANRSRKLWKTAVLLAGSGLLSGIALALWNRKELTEIQSRRNQPVADKPSTESDDEIY